MIKYIKNVAKTLTICVINRCNDCIVYMVFNNVIGYVLSQRLSIFIK